MMYYYTYSIPLNVKDPGYSICWDNVQKLSITRHHLRQENKMMLWALCFAAKNRISFRHLDNHDDKCSVRDIEIHASFIISHYIYTFELYDQLINQLYILRNKAI